MTQSHTNAPTEAAKTSNISHVTALAVQKTPEQATGNPPTVGQRVVDAVSGGSPNTSASSFSTLLGQIQSSPSMQTNMLLHLQRSYGNSYVGGVIQRKGKGTGSALAESQAASPVSGTPGPIQAKLTVSLPGDRDEEEADKVAEQVMRMPTSQAVQNSKSSAHPSPLQVQRLSPQAEEVHRQPEEEEEALQAKEAADHTPKVTPELQGSIHSLRGGGQPLPEATRAFMEPRFGYDFSQVRVHTDARAVESTKALNALAYTVGNDVVFGVGQYAPETQVGRKLLAHELTHIVQQQRWSQSIAPSRIMRKEYSLPSQETLQREIEELEVRLVNLVRQNQDISRPEVVKVQKMLELKRVLALETDPTRQSIIFHRIRLRELGEKIAAYPLASSPERKKIAQDIYLHEVLLTQALDANMKRLEKKKNSLRVQIERQSAYQGYLSGMSLKTLKNELAATETEYEENKAELNVSRRVFSPEKVAAVAHKYKFVVKPDMTYHCLGAFFVGLGELYTRAEANDIKRVALRGSFQVDRIMDLVVEHGHAGEMTLLRYDAHNNTWVPDAEQTVLRMVNSDHPGWYFFGFSHSGAKHSVILAVDNLERGRPQIYWMDQTSRGFTSANNQTGRLERKMKQEVYKVHHDEHDPSTWRFENSKIWPLLPTPEAVIEIELTEYV